MVNTSDLIRKALIGLTTIFTGILILILTGLYKPSLFNIEVVIMMAFFNAYLLTMLFYKNRTFEGLTLFLLVSLLLINPVAGLFCFIVGTIIYKPISNKSLKTPATQTQ